MCVEFSPAKPQALGPPFFGHLQVIIQNIHGCPPYPKVFAFIRNVRTRRAVETSDPLNIAMS